ncbi:hypothetical protein GJR96_04155 [Haloferax sp. MBLA0076]|uniref:DUF7344 domain-containing protein n=1 Tax=Haloferax litoreum TaxID=2666140 RepID=A0A6A8GHD8_9EURY|nr:MULTISPECIES: hypothetical protein [Haloferax]KAB1192674.1 hypothetical protein Hfx1148_04145 [Haloferax sp. CBA1148]MRX21150.1 hypothetical protein [Haloferax litoreum]
MSSGPRPSDYHPLSLDVCSCSPTTIRALESPVRRRVLGVVLKRRAVEFDELASELTQQSEKSYPDDDTHGLHATSAVLRHTHIPKLQTAGLVSGPRDNDVLTPNLHPDIYGGPLTTHLLRSVDQDVWAAVAAVHRDRRRGEVLSLLANAGPTLTLTSLASRLVESSVRESGGTSERRSETKADVEITLHHVHLPVLAKVGLVDYDTTSGEVTYAGDRWFGLAEFVETLPPRMRAEP